MPGLDRNFDRGNKVKAERLKKFYPVAFSVILAATILTPLACTNFDWELAKKDQETLQPIRKIFPEAHYYIFDQGTEVYTLFDYDKKKLGYAFYTETYGYCSDITILVGLKDKKAIKSIWVVSQEESPAYWDMLVSADFFYQFVGVEIARCNTGEDGRVDIVSGATQSSVAIIDIVRVTAAEKVKLIR